MRLTGSLAVACAVAAATLLAAPCMANDTGLGYYWQSITGHLNMMQSARPVADVIADPATPQAKRARLILAQDIRAFASAQLQLPSNASYTRFADLGRSAVVWNVVAAPQLSLQLKTWCFPVAGCVGYKGYYSEAAALAEAESLRAQGLEVSVYPVPAYSTLGKLNWLGGDPLLNTFLNYPDGEMARLIFHELAHQVAYAPGDTPFNESFATAVERIGGKLWLATQASSAAAAAFDLRDARQRDFRALTARTRDRLVLAYSTEKAEENCQNMPSVQCPRHIFATKLEAKQKVFAQFKSEYEQLKAQWGGFTGYDTWITKANNASLGAQAAYDDLVPQFEAVFAAKGKDFAKFYDAIKTLAALPTEQRRAALELAGKPP